MSTLTGQTILIIGGTSGIGFGIADASLQSGAATVIVASSSSAKVDKAVERLRANSSNHQTVKGVVIDGKDLASLEQVVKSVGTINHLVFTSGDTIGQVMGRNITTLDIPTLKDAGMFDVRLWAPIQAAKSATFAPGGSIILTSGSTYAKPVPGWSFASTVTAAVVGLTRGLAADFAPRVRVNAVAPGLVDTELFDGIPEQGRLAIFEQGAKANLVQRVGKPADIAEAYLFLMKCGYISGQTLHVDGGLP